MCLIEPSISSLGPNCKTVRIRLCGAEGVNIESPNGQNLFLDSFTVCVYNLGAMKQQLEEESHFQTGTKIIAAAVIEKTLPHHPRNCKVPESAFHTKPDWLRTTVQKAIDSVERIDGIGLGCRLYTQAVAMLRPGLSNSHGRSRVSVA